MQGVAKCSITALLQISNIFDFEYLLRFYRIVAIGLVCSFMAHPVVKKSASEFYWPMIGTDLEVDGSLSLTIIWYTDIASKIVIAANMHLSNWLAANFARKCHKILKCAVKCIKSLPLCNTLLLLLPLPLPLHPFNGLFSRTTCVSRYQKSKTSI